MTNDLSILGGLVLYLVVILAVGFITYRYMKSLDDFVLAGRRLGPWVSAISERASGESAWFLLGLPGAAYALGFSEYWSVVGIGFGILASWTYIAIPLRRETARLGALTLPDYFELRFGDRSRLLRIVSMVVILLFYTAYVGAQLHGAGKILHATFGLDPLVGILVGGSVVVFYTLMGGFLAVAWTDLVQGLLMAVVAVVLPIVGLFEIGGFGGLVDKLAVRGPEFLSMSGQIGSGFLFGVAVGGLGWGLGYLGQPHLLVRYMAIRKTGELRKGQAIAMGWVLLAYWGAPLIGIIGVAVLGPNLSDPEQVMPLLAKALVPGWLAGIMIAGATAAMMSSADSQLLVATSTLVEDIYVRLFRPKNHTPERLVLLSRLATLVISLVALGLALMALRGSALIDSMVAYAWSGLGASFGPPLVFSLWWRRTTRWGVLAGMLGGMTATVLWQNVASLQAALDIKVAAVLTSATLVALVSWVESTVSPRREEAR